MQFSILIANYNNGKYFKDCYNSIIAQTYADWEVVIVDDYSTDDSLTIIEALTAGDPRFKLYRNEKNFGCGYTKRRCAELSTGNLCGYVDPDDTITSDALVSMVEAHQKYPLVSTVHSTFYFCDNTLQPTSRYNVAGSVTVTDKFTNLEARVSHFATFKKTFYHKTPGIDANLRRAVDQDLYLKLSETGAFYFLNKALYNYRIHDQGISTESNTDKAFYCFLKVISKAEERRSVNLENEVARYLDRSSPINLEINLANPRYLILAILKVLKKSPITFFKRLFFDK